MHKQTSEILTVADAILQRKEKIEAAIQNEVGGLAALIAARLQSEREFRKLECQAAIGESSPGPGLAAARKAAEAAKGALEAASTRLAGFRQQLGEQGGALVEAYNQVAAEIPRHVARVVEAFTGEWNSALIAWQMLLGKCAEIERTFGLTLDLTQPVPTAMDLGDKALPHKTLAQLGAAVKSVGSVEKLSRRELKPGTFYDPKGIYRLTSDRMATRGLPRNTFVCDSSFEAGRLAQLVELEEARPVADRDQIPGIMAASLKADAIDKAARDKHQTDSERRLYSPVSEDQKRSDKVHDPSYHPSAAAPDKIAAGIAAGIREAAYEREKAAAQFQAERVAAAREQERITTIGGSKVKDRKDAPVKEWPETALL